MSRRKGLVETLLFCLVGSSLTAVTPAGPTGAVPTIGRTHLAFTKNIGQWDDRVLYRANVGGSTM